MPGRATKLLCGVAVGALLVSSLARAADFTIHSGETANSTRSLLGGETGTVESGGKISTTGIGEYGVFAIGADNTITNKGTIETTGSWNTLSGFGADGIQSHGDNTVITNTGTISTAGQYAYGIDAYSGAAPTITNSGTITTLGSSAYGISADGAGATVVNSGTIKTTKSSSLGIATSGANSTIVNSGKIITAGKYSNGISTYGAGTIVTNSGTILATGNTADAIRADSASTTVILLPGTAIQGSIRFTRTGTATLNIGTGLNTALTLTGVPTTINTNGQPSVLNGATLAVVDPTGFAAADRFAFDFAGAVADTLDGRMGAGAGAAVTTGAVPGAASPERRGFWISGLGSLGDRPAAASLDGYRYGAFGLMAGFDRPLSASTLAGIFGGIAHGGIRTASSGTRIDANGAFAGAYWSRDDGRAFAHLSVSAGGFLNDSDRTVANNLVTGGLETASASYGRFFVDPAVSIGLHRRLAGATVSPSLGLHYVGLYQQGYSESGSAADMTVRGRTAQALRIRGELRTDFAPLVSAAGVGRFDVRAGVDGLFTWAGDVDATLLATQIGFATGQPQNVARGFVGAGATFAAANGMIFKADATAGYDTADTFTLAAHASLHKAF